MSERWEYRDQGTNPCRYVEKFKEKSRERYLSNDEIGQIARGIDSLVGQGALWPDAGNAIKLLLLTGARVTELTQARWQWLNVQAKVLELPDSKTGKKTIYLSPTAIEILESQRKASCDKESIDIFPGRSKGKPMHNLRKSWYKVCETAQIEGVRLHDLRHTAASIAVGQGLGLPIIGPSWHPYNSSPDISQGHDMKQNDYESNSDAGQDCANPSIMFTIA